MTPTEKIILCGLLSLYREQTGVSEEEALREWTDRAATLWQQSRSDTLEADIEEVYARYPTRDENNDGRPTSKGKKNKAQIRQLLTRGGHTKEELIALIDQEVESRAASGAFLRNFETFLHNLPDLEEEDLPLFSYRSEYQ